MICSALGVEVDLKHFSDAEMGFDTAAMKVEGQAAKRAAMDAAASAVSGGGNKAAASPLWSPRIKGLDPP